MKNLQAYIDQILLSIYPDYDKSMFGYGFDNKASIRIYRADTNIYKTQRAILPSEYALREYKGETLLTLFALDKEAFITPKDGHIQINFDLYKAAFYFLSGWQEYVSSDMDHLGRFRYQDSIQYRFDCVMKPVVNYYFEILMDAVELSGFKRPAPNMWNGAKFAFHLSHDIDLCKSGWLSEIKHALKKGKVLSCFKIAIKKIRGIDPYDNIIEIAKKESENKVSATYFFLPSKKSVNQIKQADYDIASNKIQNTIKELTKIDAEIQLHGSIGTSTSTKKFLSELNHFPTAPNGNRFHFLLWDTTKTCEVLQESKIQYDSTLGFAEHIGFRNGICHPFPLYNLNNQSITQVIELPLTIMDTTFHNKDYMHIDPEKAFVYIQSILEETIKFNGLITILWHNNYFAPYKYQNWANLYWNIVALFKREKGKSIVMNNCSPVHLQTRTTP